MRGTYQPNVQDIQLTGRPVARGTRRQTGAAHGFLGRLERAVRRVAEAVVRWRTRRAVAADLNALPDWTLADIGLARTDIPQVANAIVDKLPAAGPGPGGQPPKIQLQSLVHDDPLTGRVRVVSGGSPRLAGCG